MIYAGSSAYYASCIRTECQKPSDSIKPYVPLISIMLPPAKFLQPRTAVSCAACTANLPSRLRHIPDSYLAPMPYLHLSTQQQSVYTPTFRSHLRVPRQSPHQQQFSTSVMQSEPHTDPKSNAGVKKSPDPFPSIRRNLAPPPPDL